MTMYARACEFVRDSLTAGPRQAAEIIAAAERAGIDHSAVLLAARAVAQGEGLWRLKSATEYVALRRGDRLARI